MAGAFEIVMAERKALVEKIINMMKQGDFFHNASEWDRAALRPQNPLSKVWYRGGNRMKLMAIVTEKGYLDPRWCTAKQLFEKGYHIKAGEHGTICEKWIFEKEKKAKDEYGNVVKEVVQLDRPQVMYFRVFNGEQVEDFPEYVPSIPEEDKTQLGQMIDRIIDTSECPIIEAAQDRAYYSPSQDKIVLPLRSMFKDEESFAKTAIHEMGHSTGHQSRLKQETGSTSEQPVKIEPWCYSVEEAARILGVAKSSMYEVIRKNNIHHVFVGRRILLPKKNFHEWLEKALSEPGKSLTR